MDGSLTLILPAFNEAAGIAEVIAEADDALAQFARDYEILVVDDGSTDGTAGVVRIVAESRQRVKLLSHVGNRGYGAALRTGFEAARGDLVAFTDADGQFNPADLERLISLTGPAPIVVGFREQRQDPWRRRFFSWGYNQLARRLLGTRVRDCDCALKVFRRDALRKLLPESKHFFVNTEMLTRARQLGMPITEIGVRHRPRRAGVSKVSLADIPRTLGVFLPFWWSRVLFARNDSAQDLPARSGKLPEFLALMLLASLLFFCRLRTPLLEPEEVRYAEIPRQMLAADRWIVPVLHGQDYLDKPPLFYWLVMGSYRMFGVHESSARIVAGLIGVLTVGIVYGWGRRVAGPRAAMCAAFVLCLTPEFVYRGRLVTPNGLLALWTTLALAAGHCALTHTDKRGLAKRRWSWWLLAGAATGLGLLTKGPVALALVVPPLVIVGWLDRRWARMGLLGWLAFFAMALAVAAPWYLVIALRKPEFVGYFFWFHNVLRFVAPFDHAKPFWTYLPQLAMGMLPWTLLLVPLARMLIRRRWSVAARRPGALGFALVAFIWAVLFFSLAGSKRPVYIVPALPPLALVLGCYLDIALPRQRIASAWSWFARHRSTLAWRIATMGVAMGVVGGVTALAMGVGQAERVALLSLASGVGFLILLRRERRVRWLTSAAVTFGVLWSATHELLPDYARRFSTKRIARAVVRPGVLNDRHDIAVFCYPQPCEAVGFYLRRDDMRSFSAENRQRLFEEIGHRSTSLLIVKTTHLAELIESMPAEMECETLGSDAGVTVVRAHRRREAPAAVYAYGGR